MHHLVVDLGSSNGRIYLAELTESSGKEKKISIQEIDRFPMDHTFFRGHLCTDVFAVYDRICRAVTLLIKKGLQVDTMGIDSWCSDYGLIDRTSGLISMPVFYRDHRTDKITEEIETRVGYREVYRMTTQRKIPDSTLCQLLAYQKEYPQGLTGDKKLLFLGDLLMYLFTGNLCSEISVASYSQMFSMKDGDWSKEILECFAIRSSVCPPVVRPGTVLGRVQGPLAEALETGPIDVIAPAVHDTASAAAAVPALPGESFAFLATGSWFLMSKELDRPANLEKSFRYGLSNTAMAFGKVLLKKNITAMWIVQECRRQWERMEYEYTYSHLADLAGEAEEFYAMIDTEYEGFYHPDNMVSEVLEYLKQTGQKVPDKCDAGQIVRIIYESVVMQSVRALRMLEDTTGQRTDVLYVIGGAGRVKFLNQFLSDASGILVKTGPAEATAVGNALLQAYGARMIASQEEMRETVRSSFDTEIYRPKDHEKWAAQYEKYLHLCGV